MQVKIKALFLCFGCEMSEHLSVSVAVAPWVVWIQEDMH